MVFCQAISMKVAIFWHIPFGFILKQMCHTILGVHVYEKKKSYNWIKKNYSTYIVLGSLGIGQMMHHITNDFMTQNATLKSMVQSVKESVNTVEMETHVTTWTEVVWTGVTKEHLESNVTQVCSFICNKNDNYEKKSAIEILEKRSRKGNSYIII